MEHLHAGQGGSFGVELMQSLLDNAPGGLQVCLNSLLANVARLPTFEAWVQMCWRRSQVVSSFRCFALSVQSVQYCTIFPARHQLMQMDENT